MKKSGSLTLSRITPNPIGIATPLNEGLTERFCREEAFQEADEEETAPPQEAASSSGGPNPNTQVPQESPLGKHRRKGDKPNPKEEMETEPEGRDLGKEAEEEAAAAATAAQNAAACAAAANEAARFAAEETEKAVAAADEVANEATEAAQIPTPATPANPHKLQTQQEFCNNYSSAPQEQFHPEASHQWKH